MVGGPLGSNITLDYMVEASPKPINWWARESGKSNLTRPTIVYTIYNAIIKFYLSEMGNETVVSLCSAHSGFLWGTIMSSHQSFSPFLSLSLSFRCLSSFQQRGNQMTLGGYTADSLSPSLVVTPFDCLITPIWQRGKERNDFCFLADRATQNREKYQSASIPIEICASESCGALTTIDSRCSLSWNELNMKGFSILWIW